MLSKFIKSIFEEPTAFVIAEVAQAHEGSLGMAHAYIDAIAEGGADAVKFQTHIADAESSENDAWRVKFSYEDETRTDYWRRMEFTKEQWNGLKVHAEEKGLLFMSSPFSVQAIELLDSLGMECWKVASGEVSNSLLLEHMIRTGKPIILSSGMSHLNELDLAVGKIKEAGNQFAVMQCTTAYPCPMEKIGLNMISELKERYSCPVGLSDHSASIIPSISAATLGARIFEVHVTLSREMFGPDVVASLTTSELGQLVDGVRQVEQMQSTACDKDDFAKSAKELRSMFGQSLVLLVDLKAGEIIKFEHLGCKKPLCGIPANKYTSIVGKALIRDVVAGNFLSKEDFE